MNQAPRTCLQCSSVLPLNAKFCPLCGKSQYRRAQIAWTPTRVIAVAILGAGVWSAAWFTTQSLAGTKPREMIKVDSPEESEGTSTLSSTAIEKQLATLRAKPKDEQTAADLRLLASTLITKVRSKSPPAQSDLLELIDTLSRIIKLDPKDSEALLVLGDISFEQQIFDKAANYYKQFLALVPGSIPVRARYASALTVTGNTKDAIVELEGVLKDQPDYFPALAYLTVAYAQSGKLAEATKTGERAIAKSPSKEAGEELTKFLARIKDGKMPTPVRGTKSAPSKSEAKQGSVATNLAPLDEYLRANPIAGPKFVKSESVTPQTAKLYFKDFPMQAMPPFAKEKFFGGLKQKIAAEKITIREIIFIDQATGAELDRLQWE